MARDQSAIFRGAALSLSPLADGPLTDRLLWALGSCIVNARRVSDSMTSHAVEPGAW